MKFLKGVLYFWSYLLLSTTCDGAVSSPDDKEACVGEDVNIPWRYDDNDADIASVIWSVNTTDIMTYFGSTRDPQAGFNVISANNEGSITLTSVTRSNTGTYKISVTAVQTSSDEVDVLVCDPASSAGLKGTKSDSIITCEASDLGDPEADLFIKVGGKAKTSPSAEVTIFDKVECCLSGCSVKCMTTSSTSEQYCIIAQTPAPGGGCDAGCIAGICVGVVFLLFIIGCIVGCVKAALVEDEDNFKWILLSCIIIVGLGILTVMGIRRCLNKCKEDAGKKDNSAEKPKAKPGAHSVNPHSNQATTVTLKNEHKDHGSKVRPQPSPPGGAKGTSVMHGREGSDGAVSREDVEMQESDSHFTKRPMPAIPPARDSKGRGLSANFEDTDHPLENIDTPAQRKGALGALVEDTGEGSKKVKKKKKKSNKDRDLNEDKLY